MIPLSKFCDFHFFLILLIDAANKYNILFVHISSSLFFLLIHIGGHSPWWSDVWFSSLVVNLFWCVWHYNDKDYRRRTYVHIYSKCICLYVHKLGAWAENTFCMHRPLCIVCYHVHKSENILVNNRKLFDSVQIFSKLFFNFFLEKIIVYFW